MFEINEGTKIQAHKNGVLLSRAQPGDDSSLALNILNVPFNAYILNHESRLVLGNEWVAITNHLLSLKDIHGHSVAKFIPNKMEANIILSKDKLIRDNNLFHYQEEAYTHDHGELTKFITLKMPIYDMLDRTIGILGFSYLVTKNFNNISSFLNSLAEYGFTHSSPTKVLLPHSPSPIINPNTVMDTYNLTKKEMQIIHLSSLDLTAKEIGKKLNISFRTVENHIENAKLKVNVCSKKDLLKKIFSYPVSTHI